MITNNFNTLKNLLMNFELEDLSDEELLACTYLADNFKSDCIQFIQARGTSTAEEQK